MTFEKHLHPDGVVQYNVTVGDRGWKGVKRAGEGWHVWANVKGEWRELEAHELRISRGAIVRDVRAVMMECADLSNALLDGIEKEKP